LILKGEGHAQEILQEARSIVEGLDQLAKALEGKDGHLKEGALRMRLSQQYVDALSQVYG
jgi:hypothetical protein